MNSLIYIVLFVAFLTTSCNKANISTDDSSKNSIPLRSDKIFNKNTSKQEGEELNKDSLKDSPEDSQEDSLTQEELNTQNILTLQSNMLSGDIVELIGSPSIVTNDNNYEVWIYNKALNSVLYKQEGAEFSFDIRTSKEKNYKNFKDKKRFVIILKFDNKSMLKELKYRKSK